MPAYLGQIRLMIMICKCCDGNNRHAQSIILVVMFYDSDHTRSFTIRPRVELSNRNKLVCHGIHEAYLYLLLNYSSKENVIRSYLLEYGKDEQHHSARLTEMTEFEH